MKKLLVAIAAIALSAATLPASANGYDVSISKADGLAIPEASVTVSVAGIPQEQGIYLMLCEGTSANPRPVNCSAAHQAWLSTAASALRMGAAAALPINEFKIASSFSTRAGVAVDCTTAKCGVFVRRDHFGSADVSLDRFIPVSFATPKPKVSALVGGFENRVAIRVFGAAGEVVKVKLGGRWIGTALTQNNQLISFRTGAKSVPVQVYLNGVKLSEGTVKLG